MNIDHIGYVVSDISAASDRFSTLYGLRRQSEIIFDPAQRVNLAMLSSTNKYNVELIQPIDKKSPSYNFMEQGGGLHHICYSVRDIEKAIDYMKQHGISSLNGLLWHLFCRDGWWLFYFQSQISRSLNLLKIWRIE